MGGSMGHLTSLCCMADMGMKPSVRFSTACALAELWLERGEVEVAAQLLRDIERMAPQDSPPAAAQYVKLLQRAGCQVRFLHACARLPVILHSCIISC